MASHSPYVWHVLHYTRHNVLTLWHQATIFMKPHSLYLTSYILYVCHHTHCLGFIAPTKFLRSHPLYMMTSYPMYMTSQPLNVCHHTHSFNGITHFVFRTSHPLCVSYLINCIKHYLHILYFTSNTNSPCICVPYHFWILMLFLEIHANFKNRYRIPKHRAWLHKSKHCIFILPFTRTKFPHWEECHNWEISCILLLPSWSSNYNQCPENLTVPIKHKHLREKSPSIIVTLSIFLSLKKSNLFIWKWVSPLRTLVRWGLP